MAERALSPKTPTASARELMSFRLGTQMFCVDAIAVKEVRNWSQATLLPRSPSYLRGVINLRGIILPIVDIGVLMGLAPNDATDDRVIIVVWVQKRLVGLLVDEVCDLVTAPQEAVETTSDLTGEAIHTIVRELITVEGAVLGIISLEQVMPRREGSSA